MMTARIYNYLLLSNILTLEMEQFFWTYLVSLGKLMFQDYILLNILSHKGVLML